jgi:hypothetical protein
MQESTFNQNSTAERSHPKRFARAQKASGGQSERSWARRPAAATKGILCARAPVRAADKPTGGGKIRWNSGSLFQNRKIKASVPLVCTGGTWHRWQTRNWLKPVKTSGSRIEVERENQNARKQNKARRKRLRTWRSCSQEKKNEGNQAAEKGTSVTQESDGRQNPLRPKQIDEKSWAAPARATVDRAQEQPTAKMTSRQLKESKK